jgi:hypothetical protein
MRAWKKNTKHIDECQYVRSKLEPPKKSSGSSLRK